MTVLSSKESFTSPISNPRDYEPQYLEEKGAKFDAHVRWGIKKIYAYDVLFAAAQSEAEFDAILDRFALEYLANGVLIDKASDYIRAKQTVEDDFLSTLNAAVSAYESGDKEEAARLEALLHSTGELDTRAVRSLLSSDIEIYE